MHLSMVEIRNFRSFEDLTIKLQAGLNVLVGRNNTGKTNLLNSTLSDWLRVLLRTPVRRKVPSGGNSSPLGATLAPQDPPKGT